METNSQDHKGKILDVLKEGEINSQALADKLGIQHQACIGLLIGMSAKDIVELVKVENKTITFTNDGNNCLEKGGPDVQVIKEIVANGPQTKKTLIEKLGKTIATAGFNMLLKSKQLTYDKKEDLVTLTTKEVPSEDKHRDMLQKFKSEPNAEKYDEATIKEYTKINKFIKIEISKSFNVKRGKNFELGNVKQETDLTTDLILSGKWETAPFKKFNYDAMGKDSKNGALHRLLCVRNQIREIFLEQGFEEMKTNNYVESSFWNFDSLFQPQQHPSREAHDTFFLEYPKYSHVQKLHSDYFDRVREMHEIGGYDSIGWRYKWSPVEAEKNILRTHTTAVSSRTLYKLAEEYKKTGKFVPKKYFSIDRVFRNESLDNTHLAEFHQIEGFIADYNLGLGHLIGTVNEYFKRLGIDKLRFKPAYNPYTEPSMEIFAFHPVNKRWVEIGNSGVFRPEMLKPMGFPDEVSVIAWGFSLERPAMIHYHLENIRDLFGHEVNVNETANASIYYFNE